MFRSLIIGLLIVASLGAAVARAEDPGVFLPFYFIYDDEVNVEPTGAVDPVNRRVVYYESHPLISETTVTTRPAGATLTSFKLNIMRARYFSKFNVQKGSIYKVGVANNSPIDNYGMNPANYTVTGSGADKVELTLRNGEGTGLLPPAGTVPLRITRDGPHLRISWDLTYEMSPQIWYMVGDGTGRYIDAPPSWAQVTPGPTPADFDVSHYSEGYILHLRQNGTERFPGLEEAYYKGLRKTSPASLINAAWAVGKMNIWLQGEATNAGKNYFCVPFVPYSQAVKDVLGEGTSTVWVEGDLIQYKFAASPAYLSAVYLGGRWRDSSNTDADPAFDINYRFGNSIVTRDSKPITVIGNVPITASETIAIFGGEGMDTGGKTMLGLVHPLQVTLNGTSLIRNGAADGDLILYKTSPLNQVYLSAYVSGDRWLNASDGTATLDPNLATLKLPNSYIFARYRPTGFNWVKIKPY